MENQSWIKMQKQNRPLSLAQYSSPVSHQHDLLQPQTYIPDLESSNFDQNSRGSMFYEAILSTLGLDGHKAPHFSV